MLTVPASFKLRGAEVKQIPTSKKLPQFSSNHKRVYSNRLIKKSWKILKYNFAKKAFDFFFFKKIKIVSVFWSFLFHFLQMNKWVGWYSVCSLLVYSVLNLYTVPVHPEEKWIRQEKTKAKQKMTGICKWLLSISIPLGTINHFHLIERNSFLLKISFYFQYHPFVFKA